MKLLFITKLLPRKDIIGGPILIYHRIKNLSLMGQEITLIAPGSCEKDLLDKSLEPFCKKIIKISTREKSDSEIERISKKLKRPKFFLGGDGGYSEILEKAFRKIMREKHFDVIIAEYSMMGQYIEANKDIIPPDTTAIVSVHECYTKAFKLRKQKGEKISDLKIKELSAYEFKIYEKADKILTLTEEDKKFLTGYNKKLEKKICVVPHGVDTDFYKPPAKKKWNTKNILFVGNFGHYPNIDAVKNFMKNCWGRIKKQVPDAKFFGIGFNPPEEILKFRNRDIIIMQGGDNKNMRDFYWKSDIFVSPIELGTGFRGKILEALACGIPVVATKLSTFGLSPEDRKNLFITDNYRTFSDYIISLLKDVNLRRETFRKSILIGKKFDHRNAAKKLLSVITKKTKN